MLLDVLLYFITILYFIKNLKLSNMYYATIKYLLENY